MPFEFNERHLLRLERGGEQNEHERNVKMGVHGDYSALFFGESHTAE
jgi:hypothetical protein